MSRLLAAPWRALAHLGTALLLLMTPLAAVLLMPGPAGANPVVKAVSTTTNLGFGTGACLNGPAGVDPVNCNIYTSKGDVWLSGLPDAAGLADGTYFFAVLSPGGQPDPNDGGAKNLSDTTAAPHAAGDLNTDGSAVPTGDARVNRTFTMTGGTIGYAGTHDLDDNKLRLFPYDDTVNPGGVYVLAVCKVEGPGADVAARDCKYDAFKVLEQDQPEADPLTIVKDAAGSYDRTYLWEIDKSVDKTSVTTVEDTATFTYTVEVTPDGGTVSGSQVSGTITVFNPNDDPVSGATVTDQLSNGDHCALTPSGVDVTIAPGDNDFTYTCDLGAGVPVGLDNTATVEWPADPGLGLAAGSDDFTFDDIAFTGTDIDECVTVADVFEALPADSLFAGSDVCVGDADLSDTYDRTVDVPRDTCVTYDNTATFTTDDTGATGDDSETVEVCGPITGGRTMGFWQNRNGQKMIKGASPAAPDCALGAWLRSKYNPFDDLAAGASCAQVAAYTTNVIKAADASGSSMNAMLKGQMLATALSVYFTTPSLGGNKLGAPLPLGGRTVDLENICTDEACTSTIDVGPAFGGADSLTVKQMLLFASSQSNGNGSLWYGQVKATQGLAKDAFDAINNAAVFAP